MCERIDATSAVTRAAAALRDTCTGDGVGRALCEAYREAVDEPVPPQLTGLLKRLGKKGRH